MRPPSGATKFDIPDPLWRVLRECETFCVGGCCGRAAFDFEPAVVRNCVTVPPRNELPVAREQLDQLIATLEAVPGLVDTLMITDDWTGPEAAKWFSEFRDVFNAVSAGVE
jgi:hypothetical protein